MEEPGNTRRGSNREVTATLPETMKRGMRHIFNSRQTTVRSTTHSVWMCAICMARRYRLVLDYMHLWNFGTHPDSTAQRNGMCVARKHNRSQPRPNRNTLPVGARPISRNSFKARESNEQNKNSLSSVHRKYRS